MLPLQTEYRGGENRKEGEYGIATFEAPSHLDLLAHPLEALELCWKRWRDVGYIYIYIEDRMGKRNTEMKGPGVPRSKREETVRGPGNVLDAVDTAVAVRDRSFRVE